MPGLSRRMFLKRGSLAVAAAGALSAIPGLPALVSSSEVEAPSAGSVAGDAGALTEPLVAHVKDLQTGEMSLYVGEREVVYHDPRLAAVIRNAAR
jgi:hypothetical protein